MWITDKLLAICVSLNLWCSSDIPLKPTILVPEDKKAWAYTPPPKPIPPIETPDILITAPPPPVPPQTQQIIINVPPEEKKPKPKTVEPVVNPALVANRKLLARRRLAALENSLSQSNDDNREGLNPASLLSRARPNPSQILNINTTSTQERYDAPSIDSSLPVDNARIITETEPIPVILREAINSQIPSKIVLRVERNIYGSHGRNILIPKFSEIVCKHQSADHAHSSRIEMKCSRIIAAGTRYEIYGLGAVVSDQQGQGGVTGSVDRRFWEKYGTAFFLTGISTAVKIASGSVKTNSANQNAVTALNSGAEELSTKFGEITAKVLEETVSLKPIIRISQGTRMSITLGNDWYITKAS